MFATMRHSAVAEKAVLNTAGVAVRFFSPIRGERGGSKPRAGGRKPSHRIHIDNNSARAAVDFFDRPVGRMTIFQSQTKE